MKKRENGFILLSAILFALLISLLSTMIYVIYLDAKEEEYLLKWQQEKEIGLLSVSKIFLKDPGLLNIVQENSRKSERFECAQKTEMGKEIKFFIYNQYYFAVKVYHQGCSVKGYQKVRIWVSENKDFFSFLMIDILLKEKNHDLSFLNHEFEITDIVSLGFDEWIVLSNTKIYYLKVTGGDYKILSERTLPIEMNDRQVKNAFIVLTGSAVNFVYLLGYNKIYELINFKFNLNDMHLYDYRHSWQKDLKSLNIDKINVKNNKIYLLYEGGMVSIFDFDGTEEELIDEEGCNNFIENVKILGIQFLTK